MRMHTKKRIVSGGIYLMDSIDFLTRREGLTFTYFGKIINEICGFEAFNEGSFILSIENGISNKKGPMKEAIGGGGGRGGGGRGPRAR